MIGNENFYQACLGDVNNSLLNDNRSDSRDLIKPCIYTDINELKYS